MKKAFFISLLITVGLTTVGTNPDRQLLDNGWRTADNIKPEYLEPDFDDSRWSCVSLPHDWSIQFNPDSTANSGNDGGYLKGVAAVYRNTIALDSILPGKYMLYIEGAYMNTTVRVNGEEVDSHTYGYTSFRVDITDYLEPGDNSLVVTVDNSQQKNSRWYSGTGIYRHVWLEHYNPVYIEPNSMVFTTPGIRPGMAIGRINATVIDSRGERNGSESLSGTVTVVTPDGTTLQPEVCDITFGNNEYVSYLLVDFPIPDPQTWSPDTPRLYHATLTVTDANGDVAAVETVTFGLRTFDYDAMEGAFLNEKPILINGACVHHDNGMLGAAAYDAAEWHKAMMLKRAGFNAVRTSHNPPSTAFLDACDHIGLLVIDEAFDGWARKKTPHDYGEVFEMEWPVDLETMIKRDRNHPSVIAWSIGNEILERKSPEAVTTAGEMAELCRSLDPTRPVTQALAAWDEDWEIYDPLAAEHDIVGYNYMIHKVVEDHRRVPERVVWQTESYPRDAWSNYLKVRDLPYVIGDFVWTGIDYLGESGIGRHYYEGEVPGEHYERDLWPWHAGVCGDIDLTGQRKPISYYRDMLYNNRDTVYMAVLEPDGYRGVIQETLWGTYPTVKSWNWPGHEGKPISVEVITRYPRVNLYLNDKLIGSSKVDESTAFKAVFTLDYAPGTLRAVALDNRNNEVMGDTIRTAGVPTGIHVDYERIAAPGSDYDLIFVTASVVDEDGNLNPLDNTLLKFSISTNGQILATGSADPADIVGYTIPMRAASGGRAAAVVKTGRYDMPTLTVSGFGLVPAIILLKTE